LEDSYSPGNIVTTLSVGSPIIQRLILGMRNTDFYPPYSVRLSLGPNRPLSDS